MVKVVLIIYKGYLVLNKILFVLCLPLVLWTESVDDWGPFYRAIVTKDAEIRKVGPLLECSTNFTTGSTLSAVRPFFSFWNYGDEAIDNWDLLWPIGERDVTTTKNKSRLVIFGKTEEFKPLTLESFYQSYWMWPLVWFKSETDRPFSTMLIPFYGNYNEFLLSNQGDFFLFPIYSRFQRKDVASTNWFWPIYNKTEGDRVSRFRIFPFYSTNSQKDTWVYRSYLWPFFHTQHSLNPEQPADSWFLFPFYGMSEYGFPEIKKSKTATTVLWPFYTQYETEYADHPERNRIRTHFYPFYVTSDNMQEQGSEMDYYWPFYGSKQREHVKYTFVLWPFWNKWDTDLTNDNRRETTFFFPFCFNTTSSKKNQDGNTQKKSHGRLWPLYRYRSQDEDYSFDLLALFPYYEESIERNYSPLWSLYAYKNIRGITTHDFLWGFYYSRRSEASSHQSLFPVIEYDKSASSDYQVDILKGLIGWGSEDENFKLKLLWFINL